MLRKTRTVVLIGQRYVRIVVKMQSLRGYKVAASGPVQNIETF